ncbi:MAG TPA: GAF domain-containing protein [Anaerolineales bacterium]|nr:GAF domain-containing protein [Anaerolineales bacterium]
MHLSGWKIKVASQGNFSPKQTGYVSPIRLFLTITAGIFIAEVIAMAVVYYLPNIPYYQTTLIDAAIMVTLIFPFLYFFSVRPLVQHIDMRRWAEQSLRQKEELQQRFFDSIGVMIAYMDRDFNFIKVNDAYAASAGNYSPEFFEGKNHFTLFPNRENEEIFNQVVSTGRAYVALEKPFEYPDHPEIGVTYWNWSLQPVKDAEGSVEGLVLSLLDVTERKQAEQKVELERSRLRSILDTMPDGIYIVDRLFNVEYTNPVIDREFGQVGSRKCYQYFHERGEICDWCKNPEVFSGKTARWEWSSWKTGKTYDVFDTPLANLDGSISKLKLMHDITVRKQAEAQLEHRNVELQTLSASEHRQRQVAETLRVAAQALTQSLDLDTVLKALLKHLRALTLADSASAIFLEGETSLGVRAVEGYENWTNPEQILSIKLQGDTNPIFQKLLGSRKPLLIPNTDEDPDWVIYPGTEPIHSHLYVPLLVEDRLIGVVGLGKFETDYFIEEHIRWAEALVGQAAVAVQNAWLFEQVRAGRERLQFLSRRLVEVQESERRYIARELHDHAGQTLTSLMLGLGTIEREAGKPEFVRARAAELKNMTDHVLEDLHRLAVNLRPASLDHLGLTSALEQFIKAFAQDTHLPIRLKTVGLSDDDRLPAEIETTLYRIVQEALTNVIRHAQASRVDVVLERRDGSLLVIVEDDGIGFDADLARESSHLGLLGMEERTEMLGGTLTVESQPGKGTTLFVEVPYAHSNSTGG